ncbi:MAG: glycoside hydrolase [Verrucomicrobia bacterium]|jgi:1,4-alpha-glucan branching enzyme|nr:glycoside hydrolase [Verrucomicrobiota bacterium]
MASATKGKKRVTFKVQADVGSKVSVAGDFNNWNPTSKVLKDKAGNGAFQGIALLEKGKHAYKFVINDTWCVDPNCDDWSHDGFGSLNSVVEVG